MRESRSSGSVEGVMGNHDSYSDSVSVSLLTSRGDPRERGGAVKAARSAPGGASLAARPPSGTKAMRGAGPGPEGDET
jgi:hypothetical protein